MTKSTPTLTQSGLLAVLLQRQRCKVIELARRRAHRQQARAVFQVPQLAFGTRSRRHRWSTIPPGL